MKELTIFSQKEKTYEIFSDDGHEDWISKIWSADDSDYVQGEEQQRASTSDIHTAPNEE
ncbi:unnamed protein product [Albugo candida]|uniref:Uncharacterized protein n=1 Tax=Albugo candida TaxID=65357 RepID=A0A024FXN0_9STRA|nr:unnamed protein product [Albugo candida]|eukprot:CCI11786.1 unnamed protein product [Albugo candida]